MIETARLILRPHRLDDFDAAYAMWSDPAVVGFIGEPATREQAWHRLLRYAGHWSLLGWGLFAVIDRATGMFLGDAGYGRFERGLGPAFDPFPEAGWVFTTAAHGRGIAVETMQAVIAWFETVRPIPRTVCMIDPANHPSIRLAERLGYRSFGAANYHGSHVTLFERDGTAMMSTAND